jgi:hypothetical protein
MSSKANSEQGGTKEVHMYSQVISKQAPVAAPSAGAAAEAKKNTASPKPAKQRRSVCNVCGKPGPSICPMCSDKIRAEALARKKREDKGEE